MNKTQLYLDLYDACTLAMIVSESAKCIKLDSITMDLHIYGVEHAKLEESFLYFTHN